MTYDGQRGNMESKLPKKMRAVVLHGPGDYRLEEVPVPCAGKEEIIVKVIAAGICAGDLKCWKGTEMFWGEKGYANPPAIAGHEFIGEVVELGEGAAEKHGVKIGELAISEQIVPCGECRFCKSGKYWQCFVHDIYGFRKQLNGGMAEYIKYPARSVTHKVPGSIDRIQAALIEPLACSIHAVDRGNIGSEDVVVIAGCGTLGLGMVGAARLKNPGKLIAVDVQDLRLEIAKYMGADLTLNPRKEDVIKKVLDMTGGYGCDVYVEASGHPSAVKQGLQMIRRLGTFVEFGVFAGETSVDWTVIGDGKELDIRGSHLGPGTYPAAIDCINTQKIKTDKIITHRLPLEKFKEGFELMAHGEGIKIVLVP